jgi:hypothetical protein
MLFREGQLSLSLSLCLYTTIVNALEVSQVCSNSDEFSAEGKYLNYIIFKRKFNLKTSHWLSVRKLYYHSCINTCISVLSLKPYF